jgi:hypothetical protein
MGFYVQVPANKAKAHQLVESGGHIIAQPESLDKFYEDSSGYALICVVENVMFDAAAVVYNENEYLACAGIGGPGDPRPKTWLAMPREFVVSQLPMLDELIPSTS